jgi:hypothetical protein
MAILTKIEKYCDKFINNNFDKRDRKKDISVKFEWFINSMHAWYYASQSYNAKSLIGKEISLGTAQGGDAFFILVNDQLFSIKDDLDIVIETIKKTKATSVLFHLIQIKKSQSVKLGDFKNFVDIPLKVFKNIGIGENQSILVQLKDFIQKIITHDDLKNITHKFELFFYTEKNQNDITKLEKDWQQDIEYIKNNYAEYADINIYIRGSEFINNTYEQFISNDLKLYASKQNLKSINDNEYLIGFLTAEELLNCIAPIQVNSNDRVLYPDVFKNNIRLYLGATPININIEKTLKKEPEKFHLYNNGLTITTKSIDAGNTHNYQITPVNIVNGCQTANSIYNVFKVKSEQEKNIRIPVRIIIAQDDEYEKITIRTNSQNGLSEQDLISITNIQKELEELFQKSNIQGYSFFYKRQNSSENHFDKDIDFIINIGDILRANFSCLLFSPHKVMGYFDVTTSKYIDNFFEDRFLITYQIITILLKFIEEEIENNYSQYNRLKYHIAYLIYKLCNKGNDIENIEKHFRRKKSIDDLSDEDLKLQNDTIATINKNIHDVVNSKSVFSNIVEYIIEVLESDYPDFSSINEEKLLYKTVDDTQKGLKIFANFSEKFTKSVDDFIIDNNISG